MATAAGTPRFGIACAAALLVGVVACLWSPWLAPWPWLLLAALSGTFLWWRRGERPSLYSRPAGALLLGFGLAGLHAAHALWLQLPVTWEKRDAVITGRIVDLPEHEVRRTRFMFRVDGDSTQPAPFRGRLL